MNCPKCESNNVLSHYYNKGDIINASSFNKVEDSFTESSEYDYHFKLTAKINHLSCTCMECKYFWKVKDDE